jgi:hypothetical protein
MLPRKGIGVERFECARQLPDRSRILRFKLLAKVFIAHQRSAMAEPASRSRHIPASVHAISLSPVPQHESQEIAVYAFAAKRFLAADTCAVCTGVFVQQRSEALQNGFHIDMKIPDPLQ